MSASTTAPTQDMADRFSSLLGGEQPEKVSADTEQGSVEEEETQDAEPEEEEVELESGDVEEEQAEEAEEPEVSSEEESPDAELISSDNDLAKAFGVELSDLHENLKVQIGEESVPLGEVIERASQAPMPAQMTELLSQKNQALSQSAERWEQDHQATQASIIGVTNHLLSQVEGSAGLSEASLNALKSEDPEAWAVRMEEKRQLFASIDAGIRATREAQEKHEQQKSERLMQRHAEEGFRLIQLVPEWKDQEVAMKDATAIAQHVQKKYGWSDEEMADMPDHRLALMMRNDYLNDQKAEKATEAKKTLELKKLKAHRSKVPTRARQPKVDQRAKNLASLKRSMRETAKDPTQKERHKESAAELFASFFTE